MNKTLLNNRPEGASEDEFKKAWDNNSYCLEALWKTLDAWVSENAKVKRDDFDCPNHYARLAYQAGYLEAMQRVIDLFPLSAKPL